MWHKRHMRHIGHSGHTEREIKQGDIIKARAQKDVAAMLTRALRDHPNISSVLNHALRDYLAAQGYARKREQAL